MIVTLNNQARDFAKEHPTRDGSTWHLWCASLMWRMCEQYGTIPLIVPMSAQKAGNAVPKLDPDFKLAPVGSFHYWTFGKDGHVGLDTTGGGVNVFMASKYLRESLGDCIGFQSVDGYTRSGVCTYRGWSKFYGKDGVIFVPKLSVAMQHWINAGVLDPQGDMNRTVDISTLCWFMYKAIDKMQKEK
jgi:hypothetical protein